MVGQDIIIYMIYCIFTSICYFFACTDREVRYITMHLLGAGVATTFRATQVFIALLADPDYSAIFKQIREQIDKVVGRDEQPRLQHKPSLPLVEAAMFELLRYISQNPILIPHATMKKTTLRGYPIPKGTQIWANVYNLHHDSRYWDNPCSFQPQRFLDSSGKVVPPDHLNR